MSIKILHLMTEIRGFTSRQLESKNSIFRYSQREVFAEENSIIQAQVALSVTRGKSGFIARLRLVRTSIKNSSFFPRDKICFSRSQ